MPKNNVRNIGFVILWICYAVVYFTRKPLGIIKTDLEKNYKYSRLVIGVLDSALLLPYALLQIIFGNLGDSINPTIFLTICIIGSGVSTLLLGPLDQIWMLFIFLFLNGSFQSFCWPLSIKIVSTLFNGSNNQHFVLGIFGTSTFAGGTLGTFLSVYIKDALSWKWVYPIPSSFILAVGLSLFLFYKCSFKKLLDAIDTAGIGDVEAEDTTGEVTKPKKIPFWHHIKASLRLFWTVPLVLHVSIAMFSLKMIRYIFYMWLPFMLEYKNDFSSTKAGNISAIFEVGGVIGSILLGYVMDKCFSKSQFVGIIYLLFIQIISVISFLLSTDPSWHWIINASFLLFAGVMNGGIDNLLSSSIPLIISTCFRAQAPSAIVGIVNGFGSLGTFLEGPLVGLVLDYSTHQAAPHQIAVLNSTIIDQNTTLPNGTLSTLIPVINIPKADINFTGLFVIIGILSVLPTIVMLFGFFRYRHVLRTFCKNAASSGAHTNSNGSSTTFTKGKARKVSEDKLGLNDYRQTVALSALTQPDPINNNNVSREEDGLEGDVGQQVVRINRRDGDSFRDSKDYLALETSARGNSSGNRNEASQHLLTDRPLDPPKDDGSDAYHSPDVSLDTSQREEDPCTRGDLELHGTQLPHTKDLKV